MPSYSLRFAPSTCSPYVCWNMSETDEATEFDRTHGFDQDGMWTESLWPPETPDMIVFMVRILSVQRALSSQEY